MEVIIKIEICKVNKKIAGLGSQPPAYRETRVFPARCPTPEQPNPEGCGETPDMPSRHIELVSLDQLSRSLLGEMTGVDADYTLNYGLVRRL